MLLFFSDMSENQTDYQTFANYTMRSEGRPRLVVVLAVIFILLGVIFGSLFIIGALYKKPKAALPIVAIVPTVTLLPTSSVSAVLKPNLTGTLSPTAGISIQDKPTNLDRSKLQVSVLNGSGVKGAAGEVSLYLKSLGYQIANVKNADVYTYRNLTVQVKKNMSAYAPLLKKDLQSNPAFASVSASVSDEISSEAEVIVGK
jgi:hypothetical protein